MLLWSHPIVQALVTLWAVLVLGMGMQRFFCSHCGMKGIFQWKRHVWMGQAVMMAWFIGLFLGAWITLTTWGGVSYTGTHWKVALAMAPLILIGWYTGVWMNKYKKPRKVMPLVHGVNNFVLFALACWQVWTGYHLLPWK